MLYGSVWSEVQSKVTTLLFYQQNFWTLLGSLQFKISEDIIKFNTLHIGREEGLIKAYAYAS